VKIEEMPISPASIKHNLMEAGEISVNSAFMSSHFLYDYQ